ncbi:hypothetical protein C5C95_06245 [Rathayibacter sp. AY1B7]|uniref:hypothetical protein n=1 Tax=Rathayibacter sp. AY1B7 TaxID=2080532 RepID=UPI000CE85168|nr:hypothetical protein [Rathayibacter sp. AY1B7]PPH99740.1 hypothetical protein C5C95_06245 [Rathayibacter sp. AY1B7]
MLDRYLAALLPAAILLFGGLQTALSDERIDGTEAGQLLALFAGLAITYAVPLAKGAWAGLFKTGFAILAAIATLIVPLITGFTWQSLVIVVLAALSALATEIGVNARQDSTRQGRHEATTAPVVITTTDAGLESALAAVDKRARKERDTLGARR